MYAFLGTFIAIISSTVMFFYVSKLSLDNYKIPVFSFWESFAFSSLISATDPVSVLAIFKELHADINLYSFIFGESIFNDAIAIVMYWSINQSKIENHTFAKESLNAFLDFLVIFFGSFLIGALLALMIAFFLKWKSSDENVNVQILLLILTPWISYLIAEGFELSGIVAILCNGVFLHIYAAPNIPWMAWKALHIGYETAVYTCETLVFIFLGMGLFAFKFPKSPLMFCVYTIPILNISWALNIFLTTAIINRFVSKKITFKQ